MSPPNDQAPAREFILFQSEDGKSYQVQHYSLPLVIAVGYRFRSPEALSSVAAPPAAH